MCTTEFAEVNTVIEFRRYVMEILKLTSSTLIF